MMNGRKRGERCWRRLIDFFMLKNNLKLRNLKNSDQRYFIKWWQDKELISLTSGIQEKSKKVLQGYFSDMLDSEDDEHLVIIFDNKPIGHIALTKEDNHVFFIHIIIGNKKYWGKGLGTKAIKKALKIGFNKLGYNKSCLEVRPDNLRAIKAYEKCGFKKQGRKYYKNNPSQPVVLKMCLMKTNFLK